METSVGVVDDRNLSVSQFPRHVGHVTAQCSASVGRMLR
jgi:hypothetical protein